MSHRTIFIAGHVERWDAEFVGGKICHTLIHKTKKQRSIFILPYNYELCKQVFFYIRTNHGHSVIIFKITIYIYIYSDDSEDKFAIKHQIKDTNNNICAEQPIPFPASATLVHGEQSCYFPRILRCTEYAHTSSFCACLFVVFLTTKVNECRLLLPLRFRLPPLSLEQ